MTPDQIWIRHLYRGLNNLENCKLGTLCYFLKHLFVAKEQLQCLNVVVACEDPDQAEAAPHVREVEGLTLPL